MIKYEELRSVNFKTTEEKYKRFYDKFKEEGYSLNEALNLLIDNYLEEE